MAKKTGTKGAALRKRKVKVRVASGYKFDQHAQSAGKMLFDPCSSPLEESVYGGDRGYVNRFNSTGSLGGGSTDTAGYIISKPGTTVTCRNVAATSIASTTINYAWATTPGATFLNANASKSRCCGFCIAVRPVSSMTNVTGTIHFGILPASYFQQGATMTVDQIVSLLSNSVSSSQVATEPLEVRWAPAIADTSYAYIGSQADDESDRNVVVVAWRGFPAASGIQWKETALHEWCPNFNSQIAHDSTSVKSSVNNVDDVLRELKKADPNWWWGMGQSVMRKLGGAFSGYARGGIAGAITAIL